MRPPAPLSPRLPFSYLLLINIYWNSTKIIKKKKNPVSKSERQINIICNWHTTCVRDWHFYFFFYCGVSRMFAIYFGKHDLFAVWCAKSFFFFCSFTTATKPKIFFLRAHFFVIKLAPSAFLKKKKNLLQKN